MPDHMTAKPPELGATCGPAAVQVHVCNEAFRSLPQTPTSTSSLALTAYQLFNPPSLTNGEEELQGYTQSVRRRCGM